tara:strand:+ start:1452 stop:3293 length:1842 start_codon:yes stop_codon:yes gene_type:complete
MGFWDGMVQGFKDGETQRNLENERSDRKDATDKADARYDDAQAFQAKQWANTLSEQKYRRGQDTLALEREDKKIQDDRWVAGLATIAKSGSPPTRSDPNKTNTSNVVNNKQNLNHYVTILAKKPGVKDQSILNLSQYGAGVVAQAIDMYDEISVLADKDGGTIDINEFLASASVTVTPGEPLDYEAIAKSLGMTQEDLDSPYTSTETWKDAVTAALTQAPLVSADFGMTYRPPMDTDEWIKQEAAANRALMSDISGRLFALQRGEPLFEGDTQSELAAAKAGLEADDASLAIALMRPETLSMYQGNERLLEAADRFGGAFAGVLTSQRDAKESETQKVSDGLTAMFEKYDVTEADIPNFDTTMHDDFAIDRHLKENRTPFYRVDGVLLQNNNIVKPGDGPAGAEGPANPDTPTMPADNNTDPAMGQTESAFSNRQPGDDSSPRGITTKPEPESYKGEAGSTFTSFWTGRPTISDGPRPQMTKDETAAYNDMTVPQDTPERGSIFPTRGERAEANAASPNEYETPAPMQRATDERGARLDARAARNASKIEQEDGQLLLEYILEETTNPDMLEAMSQEFKDKYGEEALMSLVEEANAFQQRFFMKKGKTPFWEK